MARRELGPRFGVPVQAAAVILLVWLIARRTPRDPGGSEPREPPLASLDLAPSVTSEAAAVRTPVAKLQEKPRDDDPHVEHSRKADRLFEDLEVLSIQIEIPADGMEALRRWHWRQSDSDRVEALATVREGKHVFRDVAVQLKGSRGSFRMIDDEPALTLQFNKRIAEQRFHGLKKLSLNNSIQDPSLLSEKICREIFLAAGVPAPRAAHAFVRLNGRDLGLYVLVEGANKQFLKRHFKDTSGNLFDCGFVQDISDQLTVNCGDHPGDRSPLDRLVSAASEPDLDLRFQKVEEVLDVPRFLKFVALEALLCHWDGYTMNRNNYRVFHDVESGRLVFIPHGMDQVFGTGRGSTSQPIVPRARGMLARAILETPVGRTQYLETLGRVYHEVFDVERILRRLEKIAEPIAGALAATEPGRGDSFLYCVGRLRDTIRERAQSIDSQLANPSSLHFDFSREPEWGPRRRWRE